MRSTRSIVSATVLMIAIIGAATLPAFAAQMHPVCTEQHHDCGKTAAIRSCCCGEPDTSSRQGGPVESKVQITAPLAPIVADLTSVVLCDLARRVAPPSSGPSRAASLDLPTLFACLLI